MFIVNCPICGKVLRVALREEAPWRPFCSQRCKLVDLGRWLDGSYRISEPLTPDSLVNENGVERDDDGDAPP